MLNTRKYKNKGSLGAGKRAEGESIGPPVVESWSTALYCLSPCEHNVETNTFQIQVHIQTQVPNTSTLTNTDSKYKRKHTYGILEQRIVHCLNPCIVQFQCSSQ